MGREREYARGQWFWGDLAGGAARAGGWSRGRRGRLQLVGLGSAPGHCKPSSSQPKLPAAAANKSIGSGARDIGSDKVALTRIAALAPKVGPADGPDERMKGGSSAAVQ